MRRLRRFLPARPSFVVYAMLKVFIFCAGAIFAADPPDYPMLRIEAGMHTAMINRVGTDAANRFCITASDDKTARIWELPSSGGEGGTRLVRILRPPIGEGNEGMIYAAALSPNGKIAVCGGWTKSGSDTGHTVYLFDRETGLLSGRITGLPNVVNHLAFSRNGGFLVICLGGSNGIRVYRASDWSPVFEDSSYEGQTYGADFDAGGRLVTASYDGFIRLYDASFAQLRKTTAPGGSRPYSVSFSPDGLRVAVGFIDSAKVDVLSGKDLSPLFTPDLTDVNKGNLSSVCWSLDGRTLYAGGRFGDNNGMVIRAWPDGGRGPFTDIPASRNTLMHILSLLGGDVLFGAADPSFGVITPTGKSAWFRVPAVCDFRNNAAGFLMSGDGAEVRFGYETFGKDPHVFSITNKLLFPDEGKAAGLSPPRTSSAYLSVTDWYDSYAPKLNGTVITLNPYETSRCLAYTPDGRTFLLGTSWYLRLYNDKGAELWKTPTPGTTWGVNIAGNGKVAAAAFGDGTIRWYRMSDGRELVSFFPHNDKKRWVLWTPSGYYACSPGAEDLIGWHVNNGKSAAADFFPVSRFKSVYYRPDVVGGMLTALDEGEALRLANEEAGRKSQTIAVAQMLPPVVTILSPDDGALLLTREVKVRFTVRTPSGEPVTAVRTFVDGRPVSAERGLEVVAAPAGDERETRVAIPERDCEITLIAENRYAASEPATVRIQWAGAVQREEFVVKPKLYVLAVGVSAYEDSRLALGLAAKDAKDFAAAMTAQKGGLYRDVAAKIITDKLATKDEVLDGLDWIRKETTSKDVAMVFFAGHGVNDQNGVYYFLPVNANPEKLMRTGVPFSDIRNAVSSLAGKALFFVDTCHSGNVMGTRRGVADIAAVVNELSSAENGAVVFASSTGSQYSLEDPSWGNGAFTKALVEGLSGRADYTGKGRISVNMLDLYLSERVKELTGGRQTPTTTKPQTVPDFPIAVRK